MSNKNLSLAPNLIGVSAVWPYIQYVHGSRAAMANGALKSAQSLRFSEQAIVYTGTDYELGKTTYTVKFKNDSRVIGIVNKYGVNISGKDINDDVYILYIDLELSVCKFLHIEHKHTSNNKFGFKWELTQAFHDLYVGCSVLAGTIIAKPSTLGDDGSYGYGRNLKIALITKQETSQDASEISESTRELMQSKLYYDYTILTNHKEVPLNIYGDDKDYKIIPEIGDIIRPDGLLYASRKWDPRTAPVLLSDKALQSVYTLHDSPIYAKPGMRVVNIKVYKSLYGNRAKHHTKTIDQIEKYYELDRRQSSMLEQIVHRECRETGIAVSPELSRLISDIIIRQNKTVVLYDKKEQLTNYKIVVTLEDIYKPGVGGKVSGQYGNKTIISKVTPDKDMPGGADICMAPEAMIKRTNPGIGYEQHTTSVAESNASKIVKLYDAGDIVNAMKIVLEFLKIQESTLYDLYRNASEEEQIGILEEIKSEYLYVRFDVSRKKSARQVVVDLIKAGHKPIMEQLTIKTPYGETKTEAEIMLGRMYFINMGIIPDNWLACASAYRNHYNLPVTGNKRSKQKLPYSNNPVKSGGETENRLLSSHAAVEAMAELRERSASTVSHKAVYRSVLYADNPTNIEDAVPRDKVPFGSDSPLLLMNYIMTTIGGVIRYEDEKEGS